MTLANPTLQGERQYSPSWCGQAAAASVATDWLGRTVLPPEIDALIPAQYRIANGSTGKGLEAALSALRVPATYHTGVSMASYLPAAISVRHEVILLHSCNGYAQPVPVGTSQIAHWRVGYGSTASNNWTMNPWNVDYEDLSNATMYAADLKAYISINGVMKKDGGGVTLGEKRAWARQWYAIFCLRDPESQAAEDGWANAIADDGSNLDAVELAFRKAADQGEGMWSKLRAMVAAGTLPPDPTLAAEVQKIKTALGTAGPALTQGGQ